MREIKLICNHIWLGTHFEPLEDVYVVACKVCNEKWWFERPPVDFEKAVKHFA